MIHHFGVVFSQESNGAIYLLLITYSFEFGQAIVEFGQATVDFWQAMVEFSPMILEFWQLIVEFG